MTRKMRGRNWLSGIRVRGASAALALAAVLVPGIVATPSAQAQTYSVVYTFSGGADGAYPYAGLVSDAAGNLYGTTAYGGGGSCTSQGCGVVFKVDTAGSETVLYSFAGGADGGDPFASLIRDASGNLYGTTVGGGIFGGSCQGGGCGVVFKLSPAGNETVLYSFTGGADGDYPGGSLVRDAAGNLYGTTSFGGIFGGSCASIGCGVAFKVDPAGNETVLYSFTGAADGRGPDGLVRDAAGNMYGTTSSGGIGSCFGAGSGCGVVFKLDPTGKETVLYSFSGADGSDPLGDLILDSTGDLYGTAADGGIIGGSCGYLYGCGVVFKLDPAGNETILYIFRGKADGETPGAGVIRDDAGNLYGTTLYGGTYAYGTVFKVSPTGNETVLYNFAGGADGSQPRARLVPYKGHVYGTTVVGGAHQGNSGYGVVFSLH